MLTRFFSSLVLVILLLLIGSSFISSAQEEPDYTTTVSNTYNVLVRLNDHTVETLEAELTTAGVPSEVAEPLVRSFEQALADDNVLDSQEFSVLANVISQGLTCTAGQLAQAAFEVHGPGLVSSKFSARQTGHPDKLYPQTDNCPYAEGCFYVHTAGEPGWRIYSHAANTIGAPINYVYLWPIYWGARCI